MNKEEVQRAFGQRVREARLTLGVTQEELAHQAGLDRTYVSMVERGVRNVTLWNIYRLAEALNLDPFVLFKESPDGAQADE
ncbi:MAG: XRE family transcriptional regulator [Deltaproteobacteria bacterium]|nr:MAG: XRE family transcriptional regulator [Deltaproteobacteria bacterium]